MPTHTLKNNKTQGGFFQIPKWFESSVTKLAKIGMVAIPVGVLAFLASPDVQQLAPPEVRNYLEKAGIKIDQAANQKARKISRRQKRDQYLGHLVDAGSGIGNLASKAYDAMPEAPDMSGIKKTAKSSYKTLGKHKKKAAVAVLGAGVYAANKNQFGNDVEAGVRTAQTVFTQPIQDFRYVKKHGIGPSARAMYHYQQDQVDRKQRNDKARANFKEYKVHSAIAEKEHENATAAIAAKLRREEEAAALKLQRQQEAADAKAAKAA